MPLGAGKWSSGATTVATITSQFWLNAIAMIGRDLS